MAKRVVGFIYDDDLRKHCDKLPKMRYRATIVQDLINSTGVMQTSSIKIIKSQPATEDELKSFHSSNFVDYVKSINGTMQLTEEQVKKQELHGLMYDCPILINQYDFMSVIAGGSLTAAQVLLEGEIKFVINWFGGWHHAQKNEAHGFCYVNDIVIGIKKLQEKFDRILYLDLDVHHGDGVQNAFEQTSKVLTVSFHHTSPGYFPGTGSEDEVGIEEGLNYTINVPYREGIRDGTFKKLFSNIFPCVFKSFQPNAMVIQCGADILSGDPIGVGNVTLEGMGECVKMILDCDIPTMFLGGGGYNFPNTAIYWTYLTLIISEEKIPEDISDESQLFTMYGPTYELKIYPSNRKDENTEEYIERLISSVKKKCSLIRI